MILKKKKKFIKTNIKQKGNMLYILCGPCDDKPDRMQ